MTPEQQAYTDRNLTVCRAVGVKAGIESALVRLRLQRRPAQWLIEMLEIECGKMPSVISALTEHRDEMYDAAWKDSF